MEGIETATEQATATALEPFGEQLADVCDRLERVIAAAEDRKAFRERGGRTLSAHERERLARIQSLLGPRLDALLAESAAAEGPIEDASAPDPAIAAKFAIEVAKLLESTARRGEYLAALPPVATGRPRWL